MKNIIKIFVALVLVSLLCQNQVHAQEAPASDRIVRVAMVSEIDSIDPHQSSATDTEIILANLHDGLIDYNPTGEIIPSLAESWEISDDHLTYTFKLGKATFHNGDPVTAEDVVASYRPLAGLEGEEAISSKWEMVESIEAIDDKTVEIKLETVDSGFLARTLSPVMPAGYEEQASQPIGAGPFKFVEWKQGEKLVMERYDEYHNQDKVPQIQGVEWVLMQDPATVVLSL
ncbi:hypothetical protein HYQ41_08535 [Facklamia sp. DSM 111019]|nr:hypothetical protein [Facklamia lactis]